MERAEWLAYPWQVDVQVRAWLERYPQLVQHQEVEQYTRHKVHAITITDGATPPAEKKMALFFVPHAHEPAGTAACMNAIQQLLTGHHLDGAPSTLQREAILRQVALTFIPDGNPYGRARCPEPWWDGRRYNNREFINMVFGIGDLHSQDTEKPRWETFKRVGYFRADEAAPARIGLVYEQIGPWEFIEPNRGDARGALARLVAQLAGAARYDLTLNLHQTEFEGYPDGQNCMVMLPALQGELPPDLQQRNQALAEAIMGAWRGVGGRPTPVRPPGGGGGWRLHAQAQSVPWANLMRAGAMLTLEIHNNNPQTPAEQQLLLYDAAIWAAVGALLAAPAG